MRETLARVEFRGSRGQMLPAIPLIDARSDALIAADPAAVRAQREIGWEPRPCALEDRRLDSVTRCATIEEAASGSPGPFSWVVPPVRNWNTRLAAEMRDGHQTATSLARHPPRCTARARALGSSPRQRSASAAWTAICFSENGRTSVRRMPRRQYPASSPGAAALDWRLVHAPFGRRGCRTARIGAPSRRVGMAPSFGRATPGRSSAVADPRQFRRRAAAPCAHPKARDPA